MVKLKDYLGSLISSVNQARVLADIESARIAQEYAKDDILKHFPVPRFRTEDIELDIPIAIDSFEEQPEKDYQPIDNKSFNSHAYSSMKEMAKVSAFSRSTSKTLNSEIAKNSRKLELDLKADVSKNEAFKRYSEAMGNSFIMALKLDKIRVEKPREITMSFQKVLVEKLHPQIQPKQTSAKIENANVVVEAEKLREIPNENIVRIKMKLFEDGMQWHTSEDADGNIKSSLLPE